MKNSILFALLIISLQVFSQNTNFDINALDKEVQQAIQKSYQACVFISSFTSLDKKQSGIFSGVVIDSNGYILSAAHAVIPGKLYEIQFPDGRKFQADGLGKISSNDVAMLKINEKGSWPYATMGWSSSLTADMPCFCISYPTSLPNAHPTIRFGYIEETKTTGKSKGFIRNTCLMEPGDSGGPLFDLKGRVIGIRSGINESLDDNFDIPVNLYREYNKSLRIVADYKKLPASENIPPDIEASDLRPMPEIKNMSVMLNKVNERLSKNSITIKTKVNGIDTSILGTLVNLKGMAPKKQLKGNSFLISKSSMVDNEPIVEVKNGKRIKAKIIHRDKNNDLVLLQIAGKINGGVLITSISPVDTVRFSNLGKFLISPQPASAGIISVLGNTQFAIPKRIGSTGFITNYTNGKIMAVNVVPNSPAGRAGLKKGDEIISLNGKKFLNISDLSKEKNKYTIDDTINIQFKRDSAFYAKQVILEGEGAEMPIPSHPAYHFTDGYSARRDGFNNILVHDGRLKPAECGGPLYDINDNFYGVNIARVSRTSSLAIPAIVIVQFIKESFLKTVGE